MNPQRPQIVWTREMLYILREYYPTMFNKALATWLKVSLRSLQRKAKELGLQKVDDFNVVRGEDISRLLSESLKKCYQEGRHPCGFPKGVRSNPQGEFPKGHKFDGDIEEMRIDKIRKTFKRRKLLKIYGL